MEPKLATSPATGRHCSSLLGVTVPPLRHGRLSELQDQRLWLQPVAGHPPHGSTGQQGTSAGSWHAPKLVILSPFPGARFQAGEKEGSSGLVTLRSVASRLQLFPPLLRREQHTRQRERFTRRLLAPISRHAGSWDAPSVGQANDRWASGWESSPESCLPEDLTIWVFTPGPAFLQEAIPLWVIKTCFLRYSTVWPKAHRHREKSRRPSKAVR